MKAKFDVLLFIIYYGTFLCNSNVSYVSSFLSSFMLTSFGIEESTMGLIFAINSLGEFCSSLSLARILRRKYITRRQLIIIGTLLQVVSTMILFFFNKLHGEEHRGLIIGLSILSRSLNGIVIFLPIPTSQRYSAQARARRRGSRI